MGSDQKPAASGLLKALTIQRKRLGPTNKRFKGLNLSRRTFPGANTSRWAQAQSSRDPRSQEGDKSPSTSCIIELTKGVPQVRLYHLDLLQWGARDPGGDRNGSPGGKEQSKTPLSARRRRGGGGHSAKCATRMNGSSGERGSLATEGQPSMPLAHVHQRGARAALT